MADTANRALIWIGGDHCYTAKTAFGTTYRVMLDDDTQRWQALHFTFGATEYVGGSPFTDEAAARAACEADYRERMRAAGWVPAGESERLREALAPFAQFPAASDDRLPPDMPMTRGSSLAAQQVTVADFRRARAALSPKGVASTE